MYILPITVQTNSVSTKRSGPGFNPYIINAAKIMANVWLVGIPRHMRGIKLPRVTIVIRLY
jgi:hypothetical protein